MNNTYTHRLLARFVIEAATPLAVGSGQDDAISDSLIARDVNGLPYIPGTSMAGVVRSMIGEQDARDFFGYQGEDGGKGSDVIFTEARMLDSAGNVMDGMFDMDSVDDPLITVCQNLPVRQHVRIGDKGTGVKGGKFDGQTIYAGMRFCFEIEMVCSQSQSATFNSILDKIQSRNFRVGGGTRNGFGEIKVVSIETAVLNLRESKDLELYLEKSSCLNNAWEGWESAEVRDVAADEYDEYILDLTPQDFFLFSSGFGDKDADNIQVSERKIVWAEGCGRISDEMILLPATSIKGAVSHRTAYHYNRQQGIYADNPEAKSGNENPAVRCLFGYQSGQVQKRGNVFFSDLYLKEVRKSCEKVQQHVMIDRFTGGAMSGALFQEKVVYGADTPIEIKVFVSTGISDEYINAFEAALSDIADGLLPLGGSVNHGHGMFTGKIKKNGSLLNRQL